MTVTARDVGDQLERILRSDSFAAAARHSRLLRYLVERTLAGDGDQLKEYVLGTEVFDRRGDYDPRIDSIVRVEARRLRRRLDEYYRGPGRSDPVLITIPKGTYVPEFAWRPAAGADGASAPLTDLSQDSAADDIPARVTRRSAAIAAAVSLGVAILAAGVALYQDRRSAQASSGPGIAVLLFEHYGTDTTDHRLVAQVTDAVTTELARLGTVSVASRTSAAQFATTSRSIREIAAALNVTFIVEGSVTPQGDRLHLSVRLVDARLDRKVWVEEYDITQRDLIPMARTIAAETAAAALRRVQR